MLWWKAIHIIAVISWMAGLLYLYRLFVYHNEEGEAVVKNRLQTMERRLFNVIATPAALLTLVSGFAIVFYNVAHYMKAGWFHTKLLAVFLLLGLHVWGIFVRRKLQTADHPYNKIWLRFLNEVPTLLMIGIVILVVLKP